MNYQGEKDCILQTYITTHIVYYSSSGEESSMEWMVLVEVIAPGYIRQLDMKILSLILQDSSEQNCMGQNDHQHLQRIRHSKN